MARESDVGRCLAASVITILLFSVVDPHAASFLARLCGRSGALGAAATTHEHVHVELEKATCRSNFCHSCSACVGSQYSL